MAHYVDLTPYITLKIDNPQVVAVGWIDGSHPFPTGSVDSAFLTRLRSLSREAWEPYMTPGIHFCELCPPRTASGSQTIWIPGDAQIFVSPELIIHYVERHEYRPPDRYIAAVLACPAMNSPSYFQGLARHGVFGAPYPWMEKGRSES